MILLMTLPSTSTAQKVTSLDFNCLTREQRERIEVAFEENDLYKMQLTKNTAPEEKNFWVLLIMTGTLGVAGGMVLRGYLK